MKNLKKLLVIISSVLVVTACQSRKMTGEEILNKSIRFHDPENKWSNLQTKFSIQSQSVFNDNNKDTINLSFNILEDKFVYHNYRTNEYVSFEEDRCLGESRKELCESKGWTKNFYTYIWGLPMKLKDEGTLLNSIVKDTIYFGVPCYALNVKYTAENWLYFINKTSYQLEGFQFIFNNDATKGEYVRNIGVSDLSGIKTPSKIEWFDLKGKKLGVDCFLP